jgi:integrase
MPAIRLLEGAYADKTIRESIKCFRLFDRWCAARGLCAFPATVEAIAAYVADMFERYATRTVDTQLHYIRRVHVTGGHPDPTRALAVRLAYRRGARTHGRPARQAHPLSADLRDRLLAACPDTLLGLRDRALISLGYDTLCRRSELVALQVEDLRPSAGGGATIVLRQSKTRPLGDGRPASISQPALDHVNAWLAASGVTSGSILRPVFQTVVAARQPNPRLVNQRLREVAELAGVEPAVVKRLTGHSLRRGAAQDLAAAGRTLLDIMRAGRWRGLDAVVRYVRDAPVEAWPAGDGDAFPAAQNTRTSRVPRVKS